MCQLQDDSENGSPESIAKDQNPAMFAKEEHELRGLVKGMDLGIPVLIVGRGSSQFSSPPRTTLGRDVEDGMVIPRVVWTIIGNMNRRAVFQLIRLISRIGTQILSMILIHKTVFLSNNSLCYGDAPIFTIKLWGC